jgi:hypothetical protein
MTLPFILPDWLPAWAFLIIALPVLLFLVAFALMPFNVFGVKARLDSIENQLAELQEDIRVLAARLPASGRGFAEIDEPAGPLPQFGRIRAAARATEVSPDNSKPPPIPPAPSQYVAPTAPRVRGRQEPRLD